MSKSTLTIGLEKVFALCFTLLCCFWILVGAHCLIPVSCPSIMDYLEMKSCLNQLVCHSFCFLTTSRPFEHSIKLLEAIQRLSPLESRQMYSRAVPSILAVYCSVPDSCVFYFWIPDWSRCPERKQSIIRLAVNNLPFPASSMTVRVKVSSIPKGRWCHLLAAWTQTQPFSSYLTLKADVLSIKDTF